MKNLPAKPALIQAASLDLILGMPPEINQKNRMNQIIPSRDGRRARTTDRCSPAGTLCTRRSSGSNRCTWCSGLPTNSSRSCPRRSANRRSCCDNSKQGRKWSRHRIHFSGRYGNASLYRKFRIRSIQKSYQYYYRYL